jgi:hypothetical protein
LILIARKHSATFVCTRANTLPAPQLNSTLLLIAYCFSCLLGASALIRCCYDALCFRNMAHAIRRLRASIRGRRSRSIRSRAYCRLKLSRQRILTLFSIAYILTYFIITESASGRHSMLPYSWIEKRSRRRKLSKHCPKCAKNIAQNIELTFTKLNDEKNNMWTQLLSELSYTIIPSEWSYKLWSAHFIVYIMFWSLIPCDNYTDRHIIFTSSLPSVTCCASVMITVNHTCIALIKLLNETAHFTMPIVVWVFVDLYCHCQNHAIDCRKSIWGAVQWSWKWSVLITTHIYSAVLLIRNFAKHLRYNIITYVSASTCQAQSLVCNLIHPIMHALLFSGLGRIVNEQAAILIATALISVWILLVCFVTRTSNILQKLSL